jgi:hypothetical protein
MSRWYTIMRKSQTRKDLDAETAGVRDVDVSTLGCVEGGRIKVPFASSSQPMLILNVAVWRSAWGLFLE